jgi:hypothetical protein
MAKIKPPINKKIYLCPYAGVVFAKDKPPLIGKIIIGSNAVTAIGTGSNIHHIAIQDTEANIAFAESDNPCG